MKGTDIQQDHLFSFVSQEERIPKNHPLRKIKLIVNTALKGMSEAFEKMYARIGRPSIAPEKLVRCLLLQILYTIRSERMLMEQLKYNLLFRWFVGLSMDDPVWDHSVFSKNRERFIASDLAHQLFNQIKEQALKSGLLSDEHFTVDGTLIEAWASLKSFAKKEAGKSGSDRNGRDGEAGGGDEAVDFHGEKRSNETHESTTDPESRLFKKGRGKEARLSFMGHVLMENRNGLVMDGGVTSATGKAECEAALEMIGTVEGTHRITVGADKRFDEKDFIFGLRQMKATPHVAKKKIGKTIDQRTMRHSGYGESQRKRKRIEEIFGWMKTIGTMRKVKHRGRLIVNWNFQLNMSAYNMVRMVNLT